MEVAVLQLLKERLLLIGSIMYLWLLLPAILAEAGGTQTGKQFKVRLSQAVLDTATRKEEFSISSRLKCAMRASSFPWSTLMCYSEDGTCLFADLTIKARSDDHSPDAVTCMTSLTPEACILDTKTAHREGEIVGSGCDLKICQMGELVPFDPRTIIADKCTFPFLNIPFVGCLFLDPIPKTWCAARASCARMDAQMIFPVDFFELKVYLLAAGLGQDVWVGVKSRKWVNGAEVSSAQWATGSPNGSPNNCGKMGIVIALPPDFLVSEEPCTNLHISACFKPRAPICEKSLLECAAMVIGVN